MKTNILFKQAVFVLLFLFSGITMWAQSLDSLIAMSKSEDIETRKPAYFHLSKYYSSRDRNVALHYAREFIELARQTNDRKREGQGYFLINGVYFYEFMADSALYYCDISQRIMEEIGNQDLVNIIKIQKGKIYNFSAKYDLAIASTQEALEYFTGKNDLTSMADAVVTLANIYGNMKLEDKAAEYFNKGIEIYNSLPPDPFHTRQIGICYSNLSGIYYDKKDFQQAVDYAEKAIKIFKDSDDPFFLLNSMLEASKGYQALEDYEKATSYIDTSLEIAERLGNLQRKREALRMRAGVYLAQHKYEDALQCSEYLLTIADTTIKRDMVELYFVLTNAAMYSKNNDKAEVYLHEYARLSKEAFKAEWTDKISEMDVKYETEKKELQIANLEKDKILYTWLGVAGAALLLLILAFLLVRQRMIKQKLTRIEKEKQLSATQAVLDGETAERTRLARDLHDGLGGMLSVVKLNLIDMKRGATLEGEEVSRFQKAMTMLDESIGELRRVAHNMMPDSLTRYGLKTALNDFCQSIPGAEFTHYGADERLDPKLEVMIYRTAHELVNNVLKHAGATEIMVNLMQEPGRVSLTVQDNGRGFDPDAPTAGMGLSNIRNRVGSYNGRMDIYSKPGEGTEVSVEFKVEAP